MFMKFLVSVHVFIIYTCKYQYQQIQIHRTQEYGAELLGDWRVHHLESELHTITEALP